MEISSEVEGAVGGVTRQSARANKGIPPERFGFKANEKPNPSPSKSSSPSVTSRMSSVRRAEAVKNGKLLELKMNEERLKLEILSRKSYLGLRQQRLTSLKERNPDELSETEQQLLRNLENEVLELKHQLDIEEAKLIMHNNLDEAERALIQSQFEADLEDVADNSGSRSQIDVLDDCPKERVKDWVGANVSNEREQQERDDQHSFHTPENSVRVLSPEVTSKEKARPQKKTIPPRKRSANIPRLQNAQSPPCDPRTRNVNSSRPPSHQKQPSFLEPIANQRGFTQTSRDRFPNPNGYPPRNNFYHRDNFEISRPHRSTQYQLPGSSDDVIRGLTTALSSAFSKGSSQLPKFDGNPAMWNVFLAAFERTYRNYDDGGNVDRLMECLQGQALSAVEHLLVNPQNVTKIMNVLETRFGRPEFVLNHLVEKVRATKSVEQSKPESLVNFGTLVDSLVTNISAFRKENYMCDTRLLSELVQKLPMSIQNSWYEGLARRRGEDVTLRHFNSWLEPKVNGAMLQIKPKLDEGRRPRHHGVHAVDSEEEKFCEFCEIKKHTTEECRKFGKLSTDERWNFVSQTKHLCFSCLSSDHYSPECPENKVCGMEGCKSKHNSLLHRKSEKKLERRTKAKVNHVEEESPLESAEEEEEAEEKITKTVGTISAGISEGSLPVIPVQVYGPKGKMKVYALLDSGANCTMLEADIAKKVGLTGPQQTFKFRAFQGQVNEHRYSQVLNFSISSNSANAKTYELEKVRTVDKLNIAAVNLNVNMLKEKYPHLKSAKAASLKNALPRMLIGYDHFRLFVARSLLEDNQYPKSPSAYRSLLGWYICEGRNSNQCFVAQEYSDENMHSMMKHFFSTESFGVKACEDFQRSREDKRAITIMDSTTTKIGEQWETGLLWKTDEPTLVKSKEMALRRLETMDRKMRRDEIFAKLCAEKFKDYQEKGYLLLREFSEDDDISKRWYLPWFFAYHPSKKPRLVFDAAAQSHGKSLNDYLLKGPDLLRPLPSVLMRFRLHTVALTADISEMFHRVSLRQKDRSAQTILYRDPTSGEVNEFEMQVLFFGSASSPASAIYCKDRNASLFQEEYPAAVKATELDFYMDDYLGGAETAEKAIMLQKQLFLIHAKGGFPLIKWSSNDIDVLNKIPAPLRAKEVVNFNELEDAHFEKTLGMYWDPKDDTFGFNLNFQRVSSGIVKGTQIPTKRMMCSLLMSLFDPLGFLAHFKVKGLMLLQQVWRDGTGWDDEISSNVFDKWKKFLIRMKELEKLRIPRRLAKFSVYADCIVQLHVFCDASEECYAAGVYLRLQTRGSINVSLVFGKARVAPMKGLSIPRMELQAGVLGSRMVKTTLDSFGDEIKVSEIFAWSDSRTFLCWLRSPTIRRNQFVGNRINEVLELTDVNCWRWVPSADNVADDATRLKNAADLTSTSRWLNGPYFLYENDENWPKEDKSETAAAEDTSEEKSNISVAITEPKSMPFPDIGRFSSWNRLIRATAYVFVAQRKFKSKKEEWKNHKLTLEDVNKAREYWIKIVQEEIFGDEMEQLISSGTVGRKSKLYGLSPLLRDGIIVVGSRLKNAELPAETVFPPILHSSHKYVQLLIDWYHWKSRHFGQERVVNEIRQSYWIIACREAVRKQISLCLICKLRRAKSKPPVMGQLPLERVQANMPLYHNCGVDYFGPYLVRIQRSTVKRWGVLFTCLSTRAVHLELAENLETSAFLNVLSRFINLRGRPAHIWSDNGTNFIGAEREMRKMLDEMDQSKIDEFCITEEIMWHHIPPGSPHMGGSWESLIGVTKKIMANLLKESHPTEDTLRTLMAEVTGIMNSRPITFLSPDATDQSCLTPNSLLQIKSVPGPSIPGEYDETDMCRKSWRCAQKLAFDFWKRWSKEYLPWLAKRNKWLEKTQPLKAGDVVLLVEDNAPRNLWKKGTIQETYPGKDGEVRSVLVKICVVDHNDKKKAVKTSFLRRPVVKVCLLISANEDVTVVTERENVAEKK